VPLLALSAAVFLTAMPAGPASAQGLFDFFFGGRREQEPEAPPAASAPPINVPHGPAAGAPGSAASSGAVGGYAYCVRLCDGRYFPLQRSNTTPEKLCGMLCPASQTKVFYGSEIEHAAGRDGTHYASTPNAYLYRKKEIAGCTCNGRDVFGLAPIDLASDPTLRPGDIVSRPGTQTTTSPAKK
jgi:hypothetical protein